MILARYIKIVVILSLFCANVFASNFSSKLNKIISSRKVSKVRFGVIVVDADTKKILYSHNSKLGLVPASNMKLLTTASAIKYLGSDYEFQTKVYLQDDSLIIVGSGDPLLGDRDTDKKYHRESGWVFEKIAAALKNIKVNRIKNIYVDSCVFDDQRIHPSWPLSQLNRYYASQVCGLNYNGNYIEVAAKVKGNRVVAHLIPETNYVNLINKAKVNKKKRNTLWCARPANSNNITLYGKCYRSSVPVKVTIDRPASYFGVLLAEKLISSGISVEGSVVEQYMADKLNSKPIVTISDSISDVMQRCNRDSFGLAAESLMKTLSAHFTQKHINGQWAHANTIRAKYLGELGVDKSEYILDDGSGLSAKNKVSVNAFARILQDVYDSDYRELFISTLAIGGVRGSAPVRSHFKEKAYRGKIFAKSGTINGVKALSGFVRNGSGNYIFSIIANKANGASRAAINDIVKAVVDNKGTHRQKNLR